MIKIWILIFVVAIGFVRVNAQPLHPQDIITQFVKDWQRAKAYTTDYLNTMPADKYGSRAVDSIRSFAEQMLHLAYDNINLVNVATGKPKIFPGFTMEKSEGAKSKDSVVYYVNASYDFAIDAIKEMKPTSFGEITSLGRFKETRFAWLLKAFEHQTHHRGQCTIYIRLQGIRPPNEQLL